MRSVSLILKFPIFVILVLPFVNRASTANVMTRSGVLFISTVPRDFSLLATFTNVPFFCSIVLHPIFLKELFCWDVMLSMLLCKMLRKRRFPLHKFLLVVWFLYVLLVRLRIV